MKLITKLIGLENLYLGLGCTVIALDVELKGLNDNKTIITIEYSLS